MKNFFLNPYQLRQRNFSSSLLISVCTGSFIFFFLYLFQPFGIAFSAFEKETLILSGYGLITTAVTFLMTYAIPLIFRKFFSESGWKIINEILYISLILFIIAVFNLLYTRLLFPGLNFSIQNFLIFLVYDLMIGIFPVIFYVTARYIIFLKKNINALLEINNSLKAIHNNIDNNEALSKSDGQSVLIKSENGKEEFIIETDNLFYVESEGNSINIHYQKNGVLKTKLIRTSLKNALSELSIYPGIIQCHRTFIVNLNKVDSASGNSQGLRLQLQNDLVVPVSRSYINKIKSALQSIK
jgi:hypothetical protein